ncbi:RBBP9/YdeN family alpha/beta hydrolase [Labilibacter marinus]|uniref:RBBP9/YdeN family alpha/beta hydrolase n=1 Tax=Labilibacter marinus TaxID=1477105 RepID=UPI00082DF483|nr:alpha/beta hydrolase [Labilibacter marinus]
MIQYYTLPGFGGSNENHWQSIFERLLPNCNRIEQANWDEPNREDWVETIEKNLESVDLSNVVFVTHSLGGITLAHWFKAYGKKVKGAFIVAPPHLDENLQVEEIKNFLPVPKGELAFPSILIASTNDQWSAIEDSEKLAKYWGSSFVNIGDAGHVNADSGFGEWEQGQELLKSFVEKL